MKLLLIGFDALSPQFLFPRRHKLPVIDKLCSDGVFGELESYDDIPWTGPAWTTIYTGVLPEVHGITDGWGRAIGGSCVFPTPKAKYIWNELCEQGYSCGVFNMPCTYPPVPMESEGYGYGSWMVSGFPSPDPNKWDISLPISIQKTEIVQDGDIIKRYYTDPIQFFTCTIMGQDESRMGSWYNICLNSGEKKVSEVIETISRHQLQVGLRLFKNHPVDVGFCQFSFLDRIGHLYGFAEEVPERVDRWYGLVDEFVKQLMEELKPERYIIVSDHGFERDQHLRDGVYITNCQAKPTRYGKIENVASLIKFQLGIDKEVAGFNQVANQLKVLGYLD